MPADFAKALALGADAVAVSNAAMQAIGCLGMRACATNNCPVGIATQRPELRARLPVEAAAGWLHNFFTASVELMAVLARACGHTHLGEFAPTTSPPSTATWLTSPTCASAASASEPRRRPDTSKPKTHVFGKAHL